MNKMSPRPQMRLPVQSAPVARKLGSAALNGSGMEPSDWTDILKATAPLLSMI
jgi:hypothetical protein